SAFTWCKGGSPVRAAPARDAEHAHRPPKGIRANGRRGARARAGLPAGRILFLPLVLGAALFLSGCWSAREIDTLAFIMAVGPDRADEKALIVSYRIADPSSLAGAKAAPKAVKGEIGRASCRESEKYSVGSGRFIKEQKVR